ncbi:site-specific integrase [Enterococcus faecium]|nr:site-specific integrase [Enterococcus faecium]
MQDPILKSFGTQISKTGLKKSYYDYIHPVSGKRSRMYASWKKNEFTSARQAKKFLEKRIDELYEEWQGKSKEKVNTFGELVDIWYENWAPSVRQTTEYAQMKLLRNIVYPVIPRELPIGNLTKHFVVHAWNNKILKRKSKSKQEPLQGATLKKVKSLIRQITYYGYLNGFMDNLKFGKTDFSIPDDRFITAETKQLNKWLTQKEMKQLLSVTKEYYLRFVGESTRWDFLYLDLMEFLARTGLRIGEAAALKINDVNFDTRKLVINKTLVYHGKKVDNYEINAPKTKHSLRIIDLDSRCVEILTNRIAFNRKRIEDVRNRAKGQVLSKEYVSSSGKKVRKKIQPRKNFNETDYIFQLQTGNPVNDSEVNRFINERNKKTRITCIDQMLREKYPMWCKHVTTHTFRYTHISYLAEKKVPIKAVMRRVGHKDSKTTLEIYNQVTEQMNIELMTALEDAKFDELL